MAKYEPLDMKRALEEHDGNVAQAAASLGLRRATYWNRLKKHGMLPSQESEPLPEGTFVPDADELPDTHVGESTREYTYGGGTGTQRYILTSAQNNVMAHPQFMDNLEALAKDQDAHLLISYSVYDRTGYRGLVKKGDTRVKRQDVWWDERVRPYQANDRTHLHDRLAFCGELDILATAADPLSSLDAYHGRASIIVPHNKFAFRCVESRAGQMPKEMFTTGSVTPRKFIQRKAGQLAQFHHVLGALLVEVTEDGFWHVHHLNAEEDGSFYWLDKRVEGGKVTRNKEGISAVVLGDIHVEKMAVGGLDTAFGVTTEMLTEVQPKHVVVHDLIDFRSRNHHNRDNPIFKLKMHKEQITISQELDRAAYFINTLQRVCPIRTDIVVTRANHDQAFDKWVVESDWRNDPTNAELLLDTAGAMVRAAKKGTGFNALEYHLNRRGVQHQCKTRGGRRMRLPDVKFLKLDESHEIKGIECGMHGHVGPSGTRGMPKQFRRLGFRSFTAHTHSPSIYDGAYTVGVLGDLNMGYNIGPSKWMHAHGIVYPNGKRAFVFIKNGRYRG